MHISFLVTKIFPNPNITLSFIYETLMILRCSSELYISSDSCLLIYEEEKLFKIHLHNQYPYPCFKRDISWRLPFNIYNRMSFRAKRKIKDRVYFFTPCHILGLASLTLSHLQTR